MVSSVFVEKYTVVATHAPFIINFFLLILITRTSSVINSCFSRRNNNNIVDLYHLYTVCTIISSRYLFCILFSYCCSARLEDDKCSCVCLLWHRLRVANGSRPKSCNEISRTRQLTERYDYNRLSARSVHIHQTLHVIRTRRLFLADRPSVRAARSPVRHAQLHQLRPISDKNIQRPGAVRVAVTRLVDIHLDQVQDRHLRTVFVHRYVRRRRTLVFIVLSFSLKTYFFISVSDTIVDELKEDVSQLKLPKSYTPRI